MRKVQRARRFRRDTASVAAVEFAFLAPVLIIMFLGTIELTCAIRLQEKLNFAAGQLAQMIAAQPTVTEGSAAGPGGTLGDMCTGVSYDLVPFGPANLSAWIASTTVSDSSGPQTSQDWIDDQSCPSSNAIGSSLEAAALTQIASLPNSMFTQNGDPQSSGGTLVPGYSAISLELFYSYSNVIPFLLSPTLTLTAVAVARPRTNTTITCSYPMGSGTASCPGA